MSPIAQSLSRDFLTMAQAAETLLLWFMYNNLFKSHKQGIMVKTSVYTGEATIS